jgi:hypothetical protein
MNALRFIHLCWQSWRTLKRRRVAYVVCEEHGVPALAMFVARDREAWRVVQYALETGLAKPPATMQ